MIPKKPTRVRKKVGLDLEDREPEKNVGLDLEYREPEKRVGLDLEDRAHSNQTSYALQV